MERYADGKPIEFSIQFCKKSTGELITYERAVLSLHFIAAVVQSMYCKPVKPHHARSGAALSPSLIISKYISNEIRATT